MIKAQNKNRIMLFAFLLLPILGFSQEEVAVEGTTVFSNALFNTLLVLIIILLIVIIALGQSLKNIAGSDYVLDKFSKSKTDESKKDNNNTTKVVSSILLLFAGYSLQAEPSNSTPSTWLVGGLEMSTFFSLLSIILLEAGVILILYYLIMGFIKTEKKVVAQKPKTKSILEKINASVDIEKEQDIMLGHDYDGIRELDNDLPPWWKYGFYLTIVIGVVYLINFHVLGTGDLQKVEYEKAMAQAKVEIDQYMKTAANNVDETTVKQLSGADVDAGKEIFVNTCAACHGKDGRGTVGPNLTDDYWLHGGSIVDIFKTVKYGWVDKGMKSWKEDLSPIQIAQVASFVRTLKGTNPAGAKAPQGDLYKEESKAVNDSTIIITDSLTVKKDSLK